MPRSQLDPPPLKHMWHIVNFIWICFTFGVLVVTVLKMLTRTRKRVTRRAILPGMTSMGMRKEIQETITNRPALDRFVFSESAHPPIFRGHITDCIRRQPNKIVNWVPDKIKVETGSKKTPTPQLHKSTSFTIVFFLKNCMVVHLFIRSTIWPN